MREGANLIHELGITFTQAALGAEVEVPQVTGTTRVRVPAGTQSGHLMRLRGKGLPQLRGGGKGDLIVRVLVWTPTNLSSEQERLLREFAAVESAPPNAAAADGDRSFWSKVKEALGGT
jgi:molecular chaperone DnaJ